MQEGGDIFSAVGQLPSEGLKWQSSQLHCEGRHQCWSGGEGKTEMGWFQVFVLTLAVWNVASAAKAAAAQRTARTETLR